MRNLSRATPNWRRRLAVTTIGGATFALACALSPNARADGVADAKTEVEKAMAKPQFVPPGEPFDISKLKGKHVWIITSTMAVPFVATIAHGVEAAAKVAGHRDVAL